jgi:hypothetical protein
MPPAIIGAVIFTLVGALQIALGVPLAARRVVPNRLYGVRTRETLADPATWYAVNARFGRHQVAFGAALAALAWAVALLPGLPAPATVLIPTVALLVGVLALCFHAQALARRLAASPAPARPR